MAHSARPRVNTRVCSTYILEQESRVRGDEYGVCTTVRQSNVRPHAMDRRRRLSTIIVKCFTTPDGEARRYTCELKGRSYIPPTSGGWNEEIRGWIR